MVDMNETYDVLLDLQEILTEKFKLEEKMDELPKMLSSRMEVLTRLKKSYLTKHNQFKRLEENIYEHQRLMGEISLRQKNLEEKTKIVKTQKEYESLDKEIAMNQQKEEEYRFQLLQDQRVIEDLRHALEKDEISINQQEEDINKEQERLNVEIDKIKEEIDKLTKKEEDLVKDMDENIRYKFERIVKNKEGIGIVTISKGHCNGCYYILPPEFINNIRQNTEIQFCPYCSRILYFENAKDDLFVIDTENEEDDDDFFED
jgi:predicted  nucleic acid-binding Zn-ribbon protein